MSRSFMTIPENPRKGSQQRKFISEEHKNDSENEGFVDVINVIFWSVLGNRDGEAGLFL